MKVTKVIVVLLIAVMIFCGCASKNVQDTVNEQTEADEKMVSPINNESLFVQNNADGSELWFNKWHFPNDASDKSFVVDGKIYESGLGYDGLTVEGVDKRGFAFVEYKIASGTYDELTGIFAFDDKTKVKPDSRLTVLADGKVIFESEAINEGKNSLEVKVPMSKDVKTIAFRLETEVTTEDVAKLIFADVKLKKAE